MQLIRCCCAFPSSARERKREKERDQRDLISSCLFQRVKKVPTKERKIAAPNGLSFLVRFGHPKRFFFLVLSHTLQRKRSTFAQKMRQATTLTTKAASLSSFSSLKSSAFIKRSFGFGGFGKRSSLNFNTATTTRRKGFGTQRIVIGDIVGAKTTRRRRTTTTITTTKAAAAAAMSSSNNKYAPGDALTNVTVCVTGSNRGIGLQLAKELLENDNTVITTARDVSKAKDLLELQKKYGEGKVKITELDVGNENSIKAWASQLALEKIKLDVVINNAGIIGTEPGYKKWTWDLVDQNEMMEVFKVNSVGPLLVSQQLLKHKILNRPALIANVTSKVGSVDDNGSGKGYAYRASKAALNIINKSMSIDLKEEFDVTCMLLHPGWVQTDMTEKRGLIETPECAKGLIKAMEGKYGSLNGRWYDYKGDEIPW